MKNMGWMWGYGVRALTAIAFALMIFGSANGGWRELYGDGAWHDIGNGWQYSYSRSINCGYLLNSGVVRFGFDYGPGQWWHWGKTWSPLSGTGLTEGDWVGDGAWHNLNNNGWSYRYVKSIDSGYWNATGFTRFGYCYSGQQWWDNRNGWAVLGASGVSEAFVGDGAFHALNNGWSYKYATSVKSGYWNTAGATRFGYDYGAGQWWDNSAVGGWQKLGVSNLSQQFVGDGGWHSLLAGWSYRYVTAVGSGYWNTAGSTRFGYDYSHGQWWDYSTWGSWLPLGASGLSQAFVGDGAWHSLLTGWSYRYVTTISSGYWNTVGSTRFGYDYSHGQWWDSYGSAFHQLGLSNYSQSFIGDGKLHPFTGGVFYGYAASDGVGLWGRPGVSVYKIVYGSSTLYWKDGESWHNMTTYTSEPNDTTPVWAANPEIRYVDWGVGQFVETRLCYWGGSDYDLVYDSVAWSSTGSRIWLTDWVIFNPGADNTWSVSNC